jgi:putative hydrolase of the HAD superfamily
MLRHWTSKSYRLIFVAARRRIVATAFAALAKAGPGPETVGDALADAYNALHDEELSMFPDAHETLDRLKELGIKLALITNGAAEPQRAKVVRFALEHRFDHMQIEGEHGFGKPEERAYRDAMGVLGVGPRETWMVGDNLEWEIVAPQWLGICAIWHDGYGIGLPQASPIRPDRIIRRLSESRE